MTHVTCMLTAKNPDQLRNPTLGNRAFTFTFLRGRHRFLALVLVVGVMLLQLSVSAYNSTAVPCACCGTGWTCPASASEPAICYCSAEKEVQHCRALAAMTAAWVAGSLNRAHCTVKSGVDEICVPDPAHTGQQYSATD